ncbi:hypothetical protein L0664_15915 [Octadecabacter sp. G9-8]|uniref:Uncharacterized protein n=1 Tax=Octadecabacter dasysiphoniae TaxID=2909341 RepID=A0ABS9CZG6_9RHOB|nr:hypothetical protein [Octadecabacter dasysiphoniae]MCF2872563.1 hypothetical protein [Octadecabacter dasysiphoniae]
MNRLREVLRLRLRHDFYQGDPAPITVVPSDPETFTTQSLFLKPDGADWSIASDATDLPASIDFELRADNGDIWSVTASANWAQRPLILALLDQDDVALSDDTDTSGPQDRAHPVLALVRAAPHTDGRVVTVSFAAPSVFWTYCIIGNGSEDTFVKDPRGEVDFENIGPETLPSGEIVQRWRSGVALPARARPTHQFALMKHGPIGDETLIPVLPAAGLDITTIKDGEPDLHCKIYVSLF